MARPLVLASASPRRRELLAEADLAFTVRVVPGAEPAFRVNDNPSTYAMRAAQAKAEAVARLLRAEGNNAAILGADTVVVSLRHGESCILGKPQDAADALRMLELLNGQTHEVCTGCCLLVPDGEGMHCETFSDTARVTFAAWPEAVLRAYVATGECSDKAGAYAIQGKGSFLVRRLEGLWSTVVGLPVLPVLEHLLARKVIQ